MTKKSGYCAKCGKYIRTGAFYPYILTDANNNQFCYLCTIELLGEFVINEDKKLLEELSKK